MPIETARLTLRPSTPELLLALIAGTEVFETKAGMRLAEGLGGFMRSDAVSPQWLAALRQATDADPWRFGFFVVHRDSGSLIGMASFKGPPDRDGMVEIAYGIAPGFQGQGYASEAALALVGYASGDDQVRLIRAHTAPEANASTGVLKKCGFAFIGPVEDPEDGLVWRWERGA
jgi:RimJ/RimL family protein N-acetyltransferase